MLLAINYPDSIIAIVLITSDKYRLPPEDDENR